MASDFTSLGIESAIAQPAIALGFLEPTPIQQQAIPPILAGLDVLGIAQTGSGKTAAYALPIMQLGKCSLVLVPTRELAIQVGKVFTQFANALQDSVKIVVAIGGLSINPQMMRLRGGADILIATPGRLLDLVSSNAVKLTDFELLVLDEADRLLELGFRDELENIMSLLPAKRQTLFFSATFAAELDALANRLLLTPTRITITTETQAAPRIMQRAILVDEKKRTALLIQLIKAQQLKGVLVFVASKYASSHVAEKLVRRGVNAAPFHGDLSQGARSQVLDEFKLQQCDVVVTTDLAARGIDIKNLPVVINYDLPRSPDDYIHRIGRTGRAGASGTAINFVSAASRAHFALICQRNKLKLTLEELEGFEPTDTFTAPPDTTGGIKGRRPSKKDKLRQSQA